MADISFEGWDPQDIVDYKRLIEEAEYYDQLQYVFKIKLNSLYGALLNERFRHYDPRLGESTTGSGRAVLKFQCGTINEYFTGTFDPVGAAVYYGDTDSIIGPSVIETDLGTFTVEELFNRGLIIAEQDTNKQYSFIPDLHALSYNSESNEVDFMEVASIYRHLTTKSLFEIEDECGNIITVTGDHSVMVIRDNKLIEVRAEEINIDTDELISITPSGLQHSVSETQHRS